MTGKESTRPLLGPPGGMAQEETWRTLVTGAEQGLRDCIRELVADRDTSELLRLYEGDLPLHEILAESAPTHGPATAVQGHPFRTREPALLSAIRAVAAAGLTILHPANEQYADAVSRWAAVAFPVARGNDATTPALPDAVPTDLRAALTSTAGPSGHVITALVLDLLPGHVPAERDDVVIRVLLRVGNEGLAAELRVAVRPDLPHRLVPDPRWMSLSTADQDFQESMEAAWKRAGADALAAGVTWSVRGLDGRPVPRLEDHSLGLAFTLVLTELVQRRQRIRAWLRWRRFQPRTTAIGRVDGSRVVGVDGYRQKLKEAGSQFPTLIPETDRAKTKGIAHQAHIVGVATVRQALRRARRRDPVMLLRTLGVFAGVLALVATGGIYGAVQAHQNARDTELESLAAQVADRARRSPGDDGQDMLLAMASDDIAAMAGRDTSVFEELSQTDGSLAKIFRPTAGAWRNASLSKSGDLAVITGDAGAVGLIDTRSRELVWSKFFPPGITFGPGQVYVTASAVSDRGIAAIGLSDNRILVVRKNRGQWAEERRLITFASKSKTGMFGSRAVSELAISSDGERLYSSGADGARLFSLADQRTIRMCPSTENVVAMELIGKDLFLTRDDGIVKLTLPDCAAVTQLRAPDGVSLHGSAVAAVNVRVAAGTTDTELLIVTANGKRRVIAEAGPYDSVRVSDSHLGAQVSAVERRTGNTVLLSLEDGEQRLRTGKPGKFWAAGFSLIWVHDGLAELHSAALDTFLTVRVVDDIRALGARWAGPHLLVRGFAGVYLLRFAATKPFLQGPLHLPQPEQTRAEQIAGDDTGTWGAGVFLRPETRGWALTVWNLMALQEVSVPTPPDEIPFSVEFVGGRLFVGYASGWLRSFRLSGDKWVADSQARFAAPVLDLAGSPDEQTVVGLTGSTDKGPVLAFTVRANGLMALDRHELEGPAGLARVTTLRDGRVVAAYGEGRIAFLSPDLSQVHLDHQSELVTVTGMAEFAGRSELVIGGRFRSIVYDTRSTARIASSEWGHAGATADLDSSASGEFVASVRGDGFATQVAIWSAKPGVRRANACAAIGRDLTQQEWDEFVGPKVEYHKVC
jgi:hypothetical protein